MSSPTAVAAPADTRLSVATRWASFAAACFILSLVTYSFFKTAGTAPFGTYWATGNAVRHGLNPYAVYPETFRSNFSGFGGPAALPDVNLNPPCLLPIFQLLSRFPIERFGAIWTASSVLAFAVTTGLLVRSGRAIQNRQILWLLLSASVFDAIRGGQIYGWLFFLAGIALVLYRQGSDTGAAIALGLLVSFKPTMAFLPIFLFLAGYKKIALRCMVTIAVAVLLPAVLYGPGIYGEWFAVLRGDQHWVAPTNAALIPFFGRAGLRLVGYMAALLLALAVAWWSWAKKSSFEAVCGVAICAGILCAPLGWYEYVLMAAPFFVVQPWNRFSTLAAALLMIPPVLAVAAGSALYLLALALILATFLSSSFPIRNPSAA